MSTSDHREWVRGFAAALGAVRRLHHEDVIVRDVMIGDGITLLAMLQAGVESFDAKAILAAIDGSSEQDRNARGASVARLRRLIAASEKKERGDGG